ncbi:MAG: serine--tRNA ligase [Fidelibacterota bacterium]|nr:MAG: serine--tRNA ligase [Candidatus Neomarinimicrobiota bacterium]
MLPLKFIRQNVELVRRGIVSKGTEDERLDKILTLDVQLREKIAQAESLKARRNKASQAIAQLKREGSEAKNEISAMGELSQQVKKLDQEIQDLHTNLHNQLLWLPNLPHPSSPIGSDPSHNRTVSTIQAATLPDFQIQDHLTLYATLGLVDFDAGSRIAGRGFPLYTGRGARLERALINFMLDLHTLERGYTELYPPFLATRKTTEISGQLPKLEEDMYVTAVDDLFLIPTAEVPLTGIHQNEVLLEDELPRKYAAFSACFRREAGSYGKETRGLLRVHQFNKVELVKFVHPEASYDELETLRSDAEEVLRRLELTYRVVDLCTGDLSFAAAKCYDLEVYAPATDQWLEVSSCSNYESFQARRGNIKFRRKDTNKLDYVHTLNGSGVATPRLMVALLETYQQPDGAVALPEALVPYYGEESIVSR